MFGGRQKKANLGYVFILLLSQIAFQYATLIVVGSYFKFGSRHLTQRSVTVCESGYKRVRPPLADIFPSAFDCCVYIVVSSYKPQTLQSRCFQLNCKGNFLSIIFFSALTGSYCAELQVFNSIAFFGSAASLVILGLTVSSYNFISICCLVVSIGFLGLTTGGFFKVLLAVTVFKTYCENDFLKNFLQQTKTNENKRLKLYFFSPVQ